MHGQLTDTVTTAGAALPEEIFIFAVYEMEAVGGRPAVDVKGRAIEAAC